MTSRFVDIFDTKDAVLLPSGLCNSMMMLHFPGCRVTLRCALARWLIQDGSDILFQNVASILDGVDDMSWLCLPFACIELSH